MYLVAEKREKKPGFLPISDVLFMYAKKRNRRMECGAVRCSAARDVVNGEGNSGGLLDAFEGMDLQGESP